MKKKLQLILLAAVVLLSVSCFLVANGINGGRGASMTVEEFNERYMGKNAPGWKWNATSNSPAVRYSDISYDPDTREISFHARVTIDGSVMDLDTRGTMYSSFKKDLGINSLVGELEDTAGQVDILRFEIYNDSDDSWLLAILNNNRLPVNNGEPETPLLLFYFLKDNELFLFETKIPFKMKAISVADDCQPGVLQGHVDGFWFQGIAKPGI